MRLLVILLMTAVLVSCSAAPKPDPATQEASAAARLQAIPPATPDRYPNHHDRKAWQNPYLIIRADGVGLLDLPNNEIHILKVDQVADRLAQLPASAWPYGRVVAVQESGVRGSEEDSVRIRANKGIVAGTLQDMRVQIEWIPSS